MVDHPRENTAVDDVRQVREKIAAGHGGDLRQHAAETNRVAQALADKLKLKSATGKESQRVKQPKPA